MSKLSSFTLPLLVASITASGAFAQTTFSSDVRAGLFTDTNLDNVRVAAVSQNGVAVAGGLLIVSSTISGANVELSDEATVTGLTSLGNGSTGLGQVQLGGQYLSGSTVSGNISTEIDAARVNINSTHGSAFSAIGGFRAQSTSVYSNGAIGVDVRVEDSSASAGESNARATMGTAFFSRSNVQGDIDINATLTNASVTASNSSDFASAGGVNMVNSAIDTRGRGIEVDVDITDSSVRSRDGRATAHLGSLSIQNSSFVGQAEIELEATDVTILSSTGALATVGGITIR